MIYYFRPETDFEIELEVRENQYAKVYVDGMMLCHTVNVDAAFQALHAFLEMPSNMYISMEDFDAKE